MNLFAAVIVLFVASLAWGGVQRTAIFATDGQGDLIREYDLNGQELGQIRNPSLNFPTFLTPDNDTRTLITDINFVGADQPDLARIDLQGTIVARNSSAAIFGSQGGGIVDAIPSGRGTFFVTSTLNTQIAEVDRDLNLIRRFPTGASHGGLRTLGGTVSPDGSRLLVTDVNGQNNTSSIRVFDTTSGALVSVVNPPGLSFAFDLAFGPSGLLFVTDRGPSPWEDDRIFVFDQLFNPLTMFESGAPLTYNFGPFTILPDGNLVVVETNFPTSTPLRVLSPTGSFLFEFGDGLQNCHGVAVMTVPMSASWAWFVGPMIFVARRQRRAASVLSVACGIGSHCSLTRGPLAAP